MPNATIVTRDLNGIALSAAADRLALQPFTEGILEASAFEVTGSTGMAVTVGSGSASSDHAIVDGDDEADQGKYIVELTDASVNVDLSAADGSNPRIDLIVLKVNDDDHDSGGQNFADVEVVEGTPAGSPSVPSLPNSAIKLAEVTVATGTTLIKSAQINDTRTKSYGRGELITTVYFTADGTFTKADYPGARFVVVKAVGGGGGGGGAEATGANEVSGGSGGGGGAYAESRIAVEDLPANETVTVGAGGSGGVGNSAGSDGETSSFGSTVIAAPGDGGPRRPASTPPTGHNATAGGLASNCTGEIVQTGGPGASFLGLTNRVFGGNGGDGAGPIGCGGARGLFTAGASGGVNVSGNGGGGGSGACADENESAQTGGDGADGVIVVEVYA